MVSSLPFFAVAVLWAMALTVPSHGHVEIGLALHHNRDLLFGFGPMLFFIGLHVTGVLLALRGWSTRLQRIGVGIFVGVLPTWLASVVWLAFVPNGMHIADAIELGDGAWVLGPIVATSVVLVIGLVVIAVGAFRSRGQRAVSVSA